MKDITIKFALILSLPLLMLLSSCSQMGDPQPEFFGVYVVDGGKLLNLEKDANQTDGPATKPDARFIVYQPSAMDIAARPESLALHAKGKVRQDVELFQQNENLQIINLHKTDNPAVVFKRTVPLQTKVGTKEGSIEIVPGASLDPGRYVLDVQGDQYAIYVKAPGGGELPQYDRYYETISGNQVYGALDAASSRGMMERKTIEGHFITKEYYKPVSDLKGMLDAQRANTLEYYKNKNYAEAYALAKASLSFFQDDETLVDITKKAPLEAMAQREEEKNWENLDRWVDAWANTTDNREDVVDRGQQLIMKSRFADVERFALYGDWSKFQSAVRKMQSEEISEEYVEKIARLALECRRTANILKMEKALNEKDNEAALSALTKAYAILPADTDMPKARKIFELMKKQNPYGSLFLRQLFVREMGQQGGAQVSFSPDSKYIWIFKPYDSEKQFLRYSLDNRKTDFSFPTGFRVGGVNVATGTGFSTQLSVVRFKSTTRVSGVEVRKRPMYDLQIAHAGKELIETTYDGGYQVLMNSTGEWFFLLDTWTPKPGKQFFYALDKNGTSPKMIKLPFRNPANVDEWGKDHIIRNMFMDRQGKYVALTNSYGTAMYATDGWKLIWNAKLDKMGGGIGTSHEGRKLHYAKDERGSGDWHIYDHKSKEVVAIADTRNSCKRLSEIVNVGLVGMRDRLRFIDLDGAKVMGDTPLADIIPNLIRGDSLLDADISPDGQKVVIVTYRGRVALLEKADLQFEDYWKGITDKLNESKWVLGKWVKIENVKGSNEFNENIYMILHRGGFVVSHINDREYNGAWWYENRKLTLDFGNAGLAVDQDNSKTTLIFDFGDGANKYSRTPLEGNPPKSPEGLEAAIQPNPTDPRIHSQLTREHRANRENAQSEKGAQDSLKLDPEDVDTLLLQAELMEERADKVEALKFATKALELAPENPEAIRKNIDLLAALSDKEKTRVLLTKLLELDGENPETLAYIGKIELSVFQDLEAAKARLESALALNKNHIPSLLAMVSVYAHEKKMDQMVATLNRVLELDPENLQALRMQAELTLNRFGLTDGLREYRQLVNRFSDNLDLQLRYAELLLSTGNISEGKELALELTKSGIPQYERSSHWMLAQMYSQEGMHEDAVHHGRSTLRLAPQSRNVHLFLVKQLISLNELDEARREVDVVFSQNRQDIETINLLTQIMVMQDATDEAVTLLDTLIIEYPEKDTLPMRRIEINMENQAWEDAIAESRKMLRKYPDNAPLKNNLALMLARSGQDLDFALSLMDSIDAKMADIPIIMDTRALVFAARGDHEKALPIYKEALAKAEENITIRYHYAISLAKVGKTEEAIEQLKKVLSMDQEFKQSEEARTLFESLASQQKR